MSDVATECSYCANEPEPGWIERRNNGPIEPCPVCNQQALCDECGIYPADIPYKRICPGCQAYREHQA